MAGEESGKKHLLIEVPDHASQSGDENRKMTTFLRMGTFDPDAKGMDLIADFEENIGFVDDGRDRGNNPAGYPAGSPGHTLTKAEREKETARLRTRGGWQDHSDGNRLTTTLGDKVEIIRGNYTMLVLGRQDDQKKAAGWDVSGGKIEDGDVYPPSYTEWKWVQTWDGTWKLTQMTEKTDVHEITHGNLKEEFYGDKIESIVGSPDDSASVDHTVIPSKKRRPEIIEKTWAKSITSDTGSVAMPIPTITETTHVLAQTSTTNAVTITDTTTVGTSTSTTTATVQIKDTTTAPIIDETTTVLTSLTSRTLGPSAAITSNTGAEGAPVLTNNSNTWAGAASDIEVIGAKSYNGVLGAEHSLAVVGARDDISVLGAYFGCIVAGVMLDIELSLLRGEIKAGLAFFEIEAAIIYVELFIGIKMEIKLGGEIKYNTTSKEFELEKTVGIGL